MSTQPTPPAAPPPPPPPAIPSAEQSVVVYSHSFLFYWWPIWLVGFIFGLIVIPLSGQLLAIVPEGSKDDKNEAYLSNLKYDDLKDPKEPEKGAKDSKSGEYVQVKVFTIKNGQLQSDPTILSPANILKLPKNLGKDVTEETVKPRLHISSSKNNGVIFFSLMLFVVFVTCVPLRGLLSIMVIMLIVFLVVIFALAGIWDRILTNLSFIDIRINQGGYLFFSTILFIMWLLVFLFYDKQIYVLFKPGAVIVRLTIGEGELVFDAQGMVLQKLRSNFFLHWILGLGTSDLVIRFGGAAPQHFDLPNVFVGANRLAQIENLTKSKAVVPGRQA
jgi:hypothetical protein